MRTSSASFSWKKNQFWDRRGPYLKGPSLCLFLWRSLGDGTEGTGGGEGGIGMTYFRNLRLGGGGGRGRSGTLLKVVLASRSSLKGRGMNPGSRVVDAPPTATMLTANTPQTPAGAHVSGLRTPLFKRGNKENRVVQKKGAGNQRGGRSSHSSGCNCKSGGGHPLLHVPHVSGKPAPKGKIRRQTPAVAHITCLQAPPSKETTRKTEKLRTRGAGHTCLEKSTEGDRG